MNNRKVITEEFLREVRTSYKHLGWMNGWDSIPKEVKKCKSQKHTPMEIRGDIGVKSVICEYCKHIYLVDTGG